MIINKIPRSFPAPELDPVLQAFATLLRAAFIWHDKPLTPKGELVAYVQESDVNGRAIFTPMLETGRKIRITIEDEQEGFDYNLRANKRQALLERVAAEAQEMGKMASPSLREAIAAWKAFETPNAERPSDPIELTIDANNEVILDERIGTRIPLEGFIEVYERYGFTFTRNGQKLLMISPIRGE